MVCYPPSSYIIQFKEVKISWWRGAGYKGRGPGADNPNTRKSYIDPKNSFHYLFPYLKYLNLNHRLNQQTNYHISLRHDLENLRVH